MLAVQIAFLSGAERPLLAQSIEDLKNRVNGPTVSIMCGRQRGSFISWCDDLVSFYNDRIANQRRLLATMGEGSQRNIEDLLYLRGVDLALAFATVIDFMEANDIHPNLRSTIQHVASFPGADLHFLARSEIQTIDDLEGQVVNFSTPGTGSFLNNTDVFNRLGIEVQAVSDEEQTALAKLRSGEIAAMGYSAVRPWKVMAEIEPEDGFHLLDIPIERLGSSSYQAVTFTSSDYPGFVQDGDAISTITVPTLLLAYNWPEGHPRCANVDKFVDFFRTNFARLQQPPYDAKWQSVDPNQRVNGLEWWEKRCGAGS